MKTYLIIVALTLVAVTLFTGFSFGRRVWHTLFPSLSRRKRRSPDR